jgi:hypothetical protein
MAEQSGLARDAEPGAILIDPGVGKSASFDKSLSILDSFFFENSGDYGSVAIKAYAEFLSGDLVGCGGRRFDPF